MEKLYIDSDVVKAFNEPAKSDVSAALTLLSSPGLPHSPISTKSGRHLLHKSQIKSLDHKLIL